MPELDPGLLRLPIAHRGLHDPGAGIVENSRAAVRAAVIAGYAVEIDIQRAACGEAMVFHDASLERMTGVRGDVAGRSALELGRLELIGTRETIPTLAEILRIVGGRVPLLIELKDETASLAPGDGVLEARVAACIGDYAGAIALMSFNPHSVAQLAGAAPDRPRGLTTCDFVGANWPLPDYVRAELAGITDFERTAAVFVSHNHRELDNPAIARLHRQGVPILCWTVRSPSQERAARRIAHNITFEGYRAAIPAG